MNIVVITGRLGQKPRVFGADSDSPRVNFSIAVDGTSYGRQNDKPVWVDVTQFGKAGLTAAERLDKGHEVHVKGRLECRGMAAEQASNGQSYDRPVLSIVADSFDGVTFGRAPRGANGDQASSAASQPSAQAAAADVPF